VILGTRDRLKGLDCTAALLTIATPQFDRLVQFYQNLLGYSPASLIPNVYAEFHLPGVRLGIFRPKAAAQNATAQNAAAQTQASPTPLPAARCPLPAAGFSLCLEVENLEAAIAHLTNLGYPPPANILTASHGREVYAYDPDGNWLILHQGTDPKNQTGQSA
jgi:catechol 2,3-dioxygenase-like lactoylglutathione lyase family enzyme